MALSSRTFLLIVLITLILFTYQAHAFGAGNIASISAVEGKNWRHGDIEDMLKTIACIRHHKWNSMMIKRVYFGNWLRDYSQAVDVGALKKAQPETIRVLVWLLSFLSFGYATAEFEVTSERLGTYRPEEHIDNPKDYADNEDARKYDPRLRGPVREIELQIDPETGMKNYIANNKGDWATSAAFVKYSFERSIHHGRLYCNGHGWLSGKDEDLAEALRCLGQGLHTLEDFGAHTNYVELVLIELGFRNVFPHVGAATGINLRGKHTYPLVTGTFGMVDFYHSVLGEATDHFTQSEVNEMDNALGTAEQAASSSNPLFTLVKLLSKVPGTRDLCDEATRLQQNSQAQAKFSFPGGGWGGFSGSRGVDDFDGTSRDPGGWPGQQQSSNNWNQQQQQAGWGQSQGFQQNQFAQQPQHPQFQQHQVQQQQGVPSQQKPPAFDMANFDPAKTVAQIYPILAFRDKVVRTISSVIEKIPGLEALVDRIVETLTVFILSLLAPFVRPLLNGLSTTLQAGSEGVVSSSAQHQFEVWTNPHSSDPTHSMLSKDHFSNLLNDPAGDVAAEILKFIAPRVLYAWEHTDVPVQQVLKDVENIFHHPVLRDERNECHRAMFSSVQKWVNERSDRGSGLEAVLSSEAVRNGKNHKAGVNEHAHVQHHVPAAQHNPNSFMGYNVPQMPHIPQMPHGGGGGNSPFGMVGNVFNSFTGQGQQQHHNQQSGPLGDVLNFANKLPIPGVQNITGQINKYSKFIPGGGSFPFGGGQRGLDDADTGPDTRSGQGPASGTSGVDEDTYVYGYLGAGSEIGGNKELHDAARGRSPSPAPMAPPSGYEQYTNQGSGSGHPAQQGGDQSHQAYGQGQDQYGSQQGYSGGGGQYGQGQQQGYGYGNQGDNYYR